jgi:hypothetical protein
VRRHQREFGAQSVHRYFELREAAFEDQLIPRMLSLRERVRSRAFMSWTSSAETVRALNPELPVVALGNSGVMARLEVNWIDDLALTVADFRASTNDPARLLNPLYLASLVVPFEQGDFEPALEHTTYREKYSLLLPGKTLPRTRGLPAEHRPCGGAIFANFNDRHLHRLLHGRLGRSGERNGAQGR